MFIICTNKSFMIQQIVSVDEQQTQTVWCGPIVYMSLSSEYVVADQA